MRMGRRSIYHLVLVTWLAAFMLLGFFGWTLQAGHLMLVLFLALSCMLYVLAAFFIRCPRCRTPVLLRPVKFFVLDIYLWSIVMPRKCRRCGTVLT